MSPSATAIPEKLFFKIGEVCEIAGVQAHVLRYWETEFPMLTPQKNRAGQRTYRRRDVAPDRGRAGVPGPALRGSARAQRGLEPLPGGHGFRALGPGGRPARPAHGHLSPPEALPRPPRGPAALPAHLRPRPALPRRFLRRIFR